MTRIGRTIPSSHGCHFPTTRINPRSCFGTNILDKGAFVLWVGRFRPSPCLGRGFGNMSFLRGHNDKLAARLRQEIGPMLAQPREIALPLLDSGSDYRSLSWILDGAEYDVVRVHGYRLPARSHTRSISGSL